MFALLTLLFITSNAQDDFWVVWSHQTQLRCLQIHQNAKECEIISDLIEEQLMEIMYPLVQKLDKTSQEIIETSMKFPFKLVGSRLVDKLVFILKSGVKSEDEIAQQTFWDSTTFVMDCIYGKEEPVWKKVKEDPFWQEKEAKEYLLKNGIDLDTVPTEEIKEDIKKDEGDEDEGDEDEWSEYEQFSNQQEL
ncbi:Uncharacterized protein QTN25_009321 [Entamoeba marina]